MEEVYKTDTHKKAVTHADRVGHSISANGGWTEARCLECKKN